MAYNTIPTIPETTTNGSKPKRLLGQIAVASFLLGACAATIYHASQNGAAASLEVTPGATYTKEWECDAPYLDTAVYGQSSGPLSTAALTVTLQGVELTETGETSFEFGRFEHVTAELVPSDGVTVSDWSFAGLIGDVSAEGDRALPGDAGVQVSCTGLSGIAGPVVNKETYGTPATAIYVAYGYAYPPGNKASFTVTAFVDDKWYQSTFQVNIVTKGAGHDGATARAVGVAALVGIAAVLLMG